MIAEKLKTEKYYLDKTSMFLKNSYGITDHFSMLITILNLVDETADKLFHSFDITKDENYVYLQSLKQEPWSTTETIDLLDKIGALYGITRKMNVKYVDPQDASHTIEETLTLNDDEMWLAIKGQIIKNGYDGTFGQAKAYYKKMKLSTVLMTESQLNQLICSPILIDEGDISIEGTNHVIIISNNIKKLFLGNVFTIESMGVNYLPLIFKLSEFALYDVDDGYNYSGDPSNPDGIVNADALRTWDNGRYGI